MRANRVLLTAEIFLLALLALGLTTDAPRRRIPREFTANQEPDGIFERISADSMLHTVKFMCRQKTRRYTSPGAAVTAEFITSRLDALGIPAETQRVTIGNRAGGSVSLINVLADLGGSGSKDNSLIMCAHYDSRGEDEEDVAPGADDNASGVAVLLEAARVLVEAGARPRVTLAFFSGEEDSLLGSSAFASDLSANRLPPRGVINVDMVGYDEYGPRDFVVFADRQSIPLAVEIMETARRTTRLLADTTIVSTGNSDHVPFWRAGWPAVSIWEGYDHNPYHCTSNDTPAVITRDFLVEMTRLVASLALHFEDSPR